MEALKSCLKSVLLAYALSPDFSVLRRKIDEKDNYRQK